MQTGPRFGNMIVPSGILSPGKRYAYADLPPANLLPAGTSIETTDRGTARTNGATWSTLQIVDDVLEVNGEPVETDGANAAYDNATSGLDAETVQDAIDEIVGDLAGVPPITVSNATATNTDNLAPTGMQHGSVLLLQGAASNGITGLTALTDGDVVTILNDTDDYLKWLMNEHTSSSAANRFTLPKGFPAFLMPGDSIVLRYNGRTTRWEVLSWANQGPAMGLTEFSDFFGTTGPFNGVFSGTSAQASSASTGVNTTEKAMGVTGVFTGTTTTGRATVGASGTNQLVPTLGPILGVCRAAMVTAVDGTETYTFYFGFHDFNNGTVTDGVAFEYRWDGAAPQLSTLRALATVETRSQAGMPAAPAAGEYYWYLIFANSDGTRYDFITSSDSMAFTRGVSLTTSLPSATQLTAFGATMIKSAGTTSRAAALDLMGYRAKNGGNRG